MLSIGTLPCQGAFEKHDKMHSLITGRQNLQDPCQEAFKKQDKTYSHLTRRQDLQDAFKRHAPLSRRVRKTQQDAFTLIKMHSLGTLPFQDAFRKRRQDAFTLKTHFIIDMYKFYNIIFIC